MIPACHFRRTTVLGLKFSSFDVHPQPSSDARSYAHHTDRLRTSPAEWAGRTAAMRLPERSAGAYSASAFSIAAVSSALCGVTTLGNAALTWPSFPTRYL